MIYYLNSSEILSLAVEIKKNAAVFYRKMRHAVLDHGLRRMFAGLATDEFDQLKRVEKLNGAFPFESKSFTGNDPSIELQTYVRSLAREHVIGSPFALKRELREINGVEDALRVALRLEKDSLAFFFSLQEAAAGGKWRKLFTSCLRDENVHLRQVSMQLKKAEGVPLRAGLFPFAAMGGNSPASLA
jgi:rubrerythrin